MQADAGRKQNHWIESIHGFVASVLRFMSTTQTKARRPFPPFPANSNLRDFRLYPVFPGRPQTKGWAMKAHEFIDSGPPVLLNNPCCCRRVVCCSFLKHAMEVRYG